MPLALLGAGMILIRMAGARRRTKVAEFVLEADSSAALRVTRPGVDPVTFRLDADDES